MRLKRPSKRFIFTLTAVFGILLVIGGSGLLYWEKRLSFPTDAYTNKQAVSSSQFTPKRIIIVSAGVDLPVEEGKIVGGIWQISNTNATHLAGSQVLGQSGNIVIYGHNKRSIFGNLGSVNVGDIVETFAENGKEFDYKIKSISTVSPSDIDVVLPTNYPILTIYTCTGFLDSERLVVKAIPVS